MCEVKPRDKLDCNNNRMTTV